MSQSETWNNCRWQDAAFDESVVAALAECLDNVARGRVSGESGIAEILAKCLIARGADTPEKAARFLAPKLGDCVLPEDLPGIAEAADGILCAIRAGEKIVVFGDFDADGITASVILSRVIAELGGDVAEFLPDRVSEGYGFTESALARCLAAHPDARLIVTVDCGISNSTTCETAVAAGVRVIVTDHHSPHETLPRGASVIVNPHLDGTPEPLRDLCGAGVAFKLAHRLTRELAPKRAQALLKALLPIVATGTVADLVPLTGENRVLVAQGLRHLDKGACIGLTALKHASDIRGSVTSTHLGFLLAPRLNAAGRIADPGIAVALLKEQNKTAALKLARRLSEDNTKRKTEESDSVKSAELAVPALLAAHQHSIAIYNADWHPGVIGLVASRLSAAHNLPVIAMTRGEHGLVRGSVRCPDHPNVDVMRILERCAPLLNGFGGHRVAAGLSLEAEKLDAFRAAFDAACGSVLGGLDLRKVLHIDAWIGADDVCDELEDALARLEPCGMKNPKPTLAIAELTLGHAPQLFGKAREHCRFQFREMPTEAVLFRTAKDDATFRAGTKVDVVFTLARDNFNLLQLTVKDIRLS